MMLTHKKRWFPFAFLALGICFVPGPVDAEESYESQTRELKSSEPEIQLSAKENLERSTEIRKEIKTLLSAEARQTGEEKIKTVQALVAMVETIKTDPALYDRTRKEHYFKLRSRLLRVADRYEKARTNYEKEHHVRIVSEEVESKMKDQPVSNHQLPPEILAQLGFAGGGNPGGNGNGAQQLGNGQGDPTLGPANDLVDLIRTVISPESWDVNGGPGSIMYYAPLRVLVISAQ